MLLVAHVLAYWTWRKPTSKNSCSLSLGGVYLGWKLGYASLFVDVDQQ